MYGTVAQMQAKPGHADDLMRLMREWDEQRRPGVSGTVANFVYRLDRDPNQYVVVAVFQDRDSYRANANDPEQDRWYRRLREFLAQDPVWNDGEIIDSSMG